MDNIFTLLISSHTCGSFDHVQILFNILCKKSQKNHVLFGWFLKIVDDLSSANSCDLGAKEMRRVIEFFVKSAVANKEQGIQTGNKNQKVISEDKYKRWFMEELLNHRDEDGNNVLMILAKHTMDGALREMLTNDRTVEHITHSVLSIKNKLRQTLISLIEVNREDMPESLALVLKVEYACHAGNLTQAEICLSSQLETSNSSFEIIKGLHQLQSLTWCQKFNIWLILFLTWLIPNYGLTGFDWFSDGFLVSEYWNEWSNETANGTFIATCNMKDTAIQAHWYRIGILNTTNPLANIQCAMHNISAAQENYTKNQREGDEYDVYDPLKAYAACISGETKFWYTLMPMIGPIFLYMIEFFVLTEDYEPTGLRKRIKETWKDLRTAKCLSFSLIMTFIRLIVWVLLAVLAIIFWMPVSAWCKFMVDGKYQTATGMQKVRLRRDKRCMDLAASRGELMEVSIEDVFEPMIQLYIIFPSIISILQRLNNSTTRNPDGSIAFNFSLDLLELGQMFSIVISMVSLAWCYSEYNSVRKNMYLDPSESPFSRIIMWFYMLCQIIARLFAFMLFTLFWNPGTFYPLMIFVLIHMILAGFLHVVFSDDLAYCRKGKYLKFFHNVTFNALSSIYFHNYIHQDESFDVKTERKEQTNTILPQSIISTSKELSKIENLNATMSQHDRVKIDLNRLHTSTLLRQIMFDVLYTIEFGVLLGFGFHSKPFLDYTSSLYCSNFYIILAIVILYIVALSLRILYYTVMHVWSNVIWSSKKLRRQEMDPPDQVDSSKTKVEQEIQKANIQTQRSFFKYVFVCRNTWILGEIKHVQITLLILPKWIIDWLRKAGKNLILASEKMRDNILLWYAEFTWSCPALLYKIIHIVIAVLIFIVLFVVLNVLLIAILLVLLLLSFPVTVLLFMFNLRKGFVATEKEDFQDVLENPPTINEEELFEAYPKVTLFSLQQDIQNHNGLVNLANREYITPEEFEVLAHKLLALDSTKYPLKTLDLTNCCVTPKEMVHLAPLMAKFDKVVLNGKQSLTLDGMNGLESLKKVIFRMSVIPKSIKLKVLELKIEKKKGDAVEEGRKLFLGGDRGKQILENSQLGQQTILMSEFDGLAMDGKSLRIIAEFLPKLEEVYLDNVFMEMKLFSNMKKKAEVMNIKKRLPLPDDQKQNEDSVSNDVQEAFKVVSEQILSIPDGKRKLKCISINGCQINDSILEMLAPALVTLEKVHLAENPEITENGWGLFEKKLTGNIALKFLSLKISKPSSKYIIKDVGNMLPLAKVLSKIKAVDISGQKEVTQKLLDLLDELKDSEGHDFRLHTITVSKAYHVNSVKDKSSTPFIIKYSDSISYSDTKIEIENSNHNIKDQMNVIENDV